MKPLTLFDPMPLGQYRGKLVGTVIESDPSYMNWFVDNTRWMLDEDALDYLHQHWRVSGEFAK